MPEHGDICSICEKRGMDSTQRFLQRFVPDAPASGANINNYDNILQQEKLNGSTGFPNP